MGDQVTRLRWFFWLVFLLLSLAVVLARILPIDLTAGRWPGPDIILCLGYAWALRRPDYVPALIFAISIFFADLMFQRPPGLFAALSLLGLEFLRSRSQFSRDLPFLVEWAMFGAVMMVVVFANWLLLTIFVVTHSTLARELALLLSTVLFYPVVALISARVLGVRKVAPGEVDGLGHRI